MHLTDEATRACPETSLASLTVPCLTITEQVTALIRWLAFVTSSAAHRPYHISLADPLCPPILCCYCLHFPIVLASSHLHSSFWKEMETKIKEKRPGNKGAIK